MLEYEEVVVMVRTLIPTIGIADLRFVLANLYLVRSLPLPPFTRPSPSLAPPVFTECGVFHPTLLPFTHSWTAKRVSHP